MTRRIQFAIVLHPTDNDQWEAEVVCNEGPTVLLAARPYEHTLIVAQRELDGMLKYVKGHRVEVFTVHTSPTAAKQLQQDDLAEFFNRLNALDADMVTVKHTVVDLSGDTTD